MIETVKENKMGTMPIGKLLFRMAAPMILSMLVQALYNVVDSIFVSHYDPNALTALSCAFPAQNLMIGVATGVGVGINALLSRSLGERNQKRANQSAANGILLAAIGYLLFLIFGLFGTEIFLSFQTDTAAVIESGRIYLFYVCCFSFGLYGQVTVERLLQSTGKSVYSMLTQLTGALTNLILDPLLIFGIGPFPELGIAGAAIATVIGQCLAAVVGYFLHFRYNREIRMAPADFRPNRDVIGKIVSVAIPSILMICIGSIMMICLNKILGGFGEIGDTAISVFGAYFKLQSFIFMPVFGLNNGSTPILAYNYGARNRSRMMKTLKCAAISAFTLMMLGLLLMQTMPRQLLLLFGATDSMMEIGIPALRTISLNFLFAGFCIVIISCFQALGRGIYATVISFARQIIVLLPAAYLLSLSGKVSAVWFAFPIAELVSVIVSLLLFIRLYRTVIRHLPENGDSKS
jgi:putative MATE family efflux protein